MKAVVRYILILLALAALLPAGCGEGEAGGETTAASMTREQFLRDYGLAGQAVLLEFGQVGCELSDAGLRAMVDLHQRNAIPGLTYARVELSQDAPAVGEYYRAVSPSFAMIRDDKRQIANLFDAKAVPTFVLLDAFGRVRYRGGFPKDKLYDWVVSLNEEKADPGPDAPQFGVVKLEGPTLLRQTVLPALEADAKPLADYAGRQGLVAVVVDTQCPFAATAWQEIGQVNSELKKHEIDCVLINIDESAETVRQFYSDKNLPVYMLYDVSGRTQNAWAIKQVPTVVYFDRNGKIRYNGKAAWADLAVVVNEQLGLPDGHVNFAAKGTEYG